MNVICFGFGFVGKAYALLLRELGHDVYVVTAPDKTRDEAIGYGFKDGLLASLCFDAAVVAVPTPTNNGKQDLAIIKQVLTTIKNNYDVKNIIIKSTVIPKSLSKLESEFKKPTQGFYMYPEFLEAQNPIGGVFNQKCCAFGKTGDWTQREKEFIFKLFGLSETETTFSSLETVCILKYVHNIWLSCNVSFWNAMKRCVNNNVDFDTVLKETHKSEYFGKHPWHIGTAYGGACCHPSTPIITIKGIIPISAVKIGDLVLTHRGNFKQVKQLFVRNSEHIYEVKLQGQQPFFVTGEHPIFAGSAHRHKMKNGKLSNWNFVKEIVPQWIKTGDLQKGDFLFWKKPNYVSDDKVIEWAKTTRHRGHQPLSLANGIIINKNIMRLLGYYIAEGCWEPNRISWCFHAKEKEYHADVIGILKNEFGINTTAKVKDNKMVIRAQSIKFASWIRGTGGVRGHKRLCSDLLFAKEPLIAEFLKGYIRGDGSKSTNVYSCTTISKELFHQLQLILLRLGVAYTTSFRKENISKDGVHHKPSYTIRIRNYVDIVNLNKWGIDKDGSQIYKTPKLLRKTTWINEDYMISPIKSINKIEYNDKVYNLEVADDESYTTIGAILHNCLPKDIKAFIDSVSDDNQFKKFIEAIDEVNEMVKHESVINFTDNKNFSKEIMELME